MAQKAEVQTIKVEKPVKTKAEPTGIFSLIDRKFLRSIFPIKVEHEHIHRNDFDPTKDSYEFGTPGKKGTIKIYHNWSDPEGFRLKIANALIIQDWTMQFIEENKLPQLSNPPEVTGIKLKK